MRRHGPFMPAVHGPEDMEYTTRPAVLNKLKERMQKLD
jgi:fructose 1,6-bisphosphate aldolase/phosphatase